MVRISLIGAAGTVGGQSSGGAQGKVGTFVTQPPDEPRPWGLLRTKLTVPRPRPDALLRSDLVEYVSAVATPGRVTLVVAGAGSGKSTLLASWVGRQPNPDRYAWFSVDEDDNDIGRYWAYVIAALTLDDPAALPMSNRLLAAAGASVITRPGRRLASRDVPRRTPRRRPRTHLPHTTQPRRPRRSPAPPGVGRPHGPTPDRAVQNQGLLGRWRAALHRAARQNNARVQTFLVPPRVRGVDDPDQLVYVVWGDATDPRRTTHTTPARPAPRPSPVTRPVTDLAGYRADRLGRARSIASHPSNFSEHDNGDHADGNHGGGIEDIEDVNR